MFVSGPGFFQPFGGFQPFGLQPFAQYVDVEPPSRGYFPQCSRQPQRNRHVHPRYPAAYPWATDRHFHPQPNVVYDYDSDSDASADEGEEEGYTSYPPHTPVRPAMVQPHQASRARSSSNSSSHSMAQAGVGQAPFWAGARQASPFAAHLKRCEPEPQPHWRQQQQQHRRPFGEPLKARQPAAAAPKPQAGAAPGARHIAVSSGPQPSAPATPQQPPQQRVPPAAAAPAALSRPTRQLRKAEAATIIQSWWRMRRLARQQPALRTLMHAAAQLREVAAMFAAYKADVSPAAASSDGNSSSNGSGSPEGSGPGFITHKQYLELNELAMRVLLNLDCCPCGVPELRAVRKRLASSAMSLLDRIQAAFSAAVNASMEVPDSAVQEALGYTGSKAGPAATTQQPQQQSAAQEPQQQQDEDVWMDVQEQQQQQQPDRMDVCEAAAESEVSTPADAAAAAAAAAAADGGSLPLPCSSGVSVPVRVVLRVAGQCCDAGTQTD